ncbi:unnamed protein product [Amoebophrya sp. A120]|nr:unnamed protein product [Amoebophrya sp. A120]|eukprot:GSA120T00003457001.1
MSGINRSNGEFQPEVEPDAEPEDAVDDRTRALLQQTQAFYRPPTTAEGRHPAQNPSAARATHAQAVASRNDDPSTTMMVHSPQQRAPQVVVQAAAGRAPELQVRAVAPLDYSNGQLDLPRRRTDQEENPVVFNNISINPNASSFNQKILSPYSPRNPVVVSCYNHQSRGSCPSEHSHQRSPVVPVTPVGTGGVGGTAHQHPTTNERHRRGSSGSGYGTQPPSYHSHKYGRKHVEPADMLNRRSSSSHFQSTKPESKKMHPAVGGAPQHVGPAGCPCEMSCNKENFYPTRYNSSGQRSPCSRTPPPRDVWKGGGSRMFEPGPQESALRPDGYATHYHPNHAPALQGQRQNDQQPLMYHQTAGYGATSKSWNGDQVPVAGFVVANTWDERKPKSEQETTRDSVWAVVYCTALVADVVLFACSLLLKRHRIHCCLARVGLYFLYVGIILRWSRLCAGRFHPVYDKEGQLVDVPGYIRRISAMLGVGIAFATNGVTFGLLGSGVIDDWVVCGVSFGVVFGRALAVPLLFCG